MRICKRCLLAEADKAAYQTIAELIALIPAEERTAEDVYRRRLSQCKECAELHDGLCAVCGCYVEHRAARAQMRCPSEEKYW